MTLTEAALKRWGLHPSTRRKPVKKTQRLCPVCMKPQVLRNFSFGKAYVCGNDECDYKRPYTVATKKRKEG